MNKKTMKSQLPKEITRRSDEGDEITINFIPLPPEKREAWKESMRLITEIIIKIIDQG